MLSDAPLDRGVWWQRPSPQLDPHQKSLCEAKGIDLAPEVVGSVTYSVTGKEGSVHISFNLPEHGADEYSQSAPAGLRLTRHDGTPVMFVLSPA